jgi:hypothetical protein
LWVNRVNLTERRPLPVLPDERTFSETVGMSQRCQEPTLAASAFSSTEGRLRGPREIV